MHTRWNNFFNDRGRFYHLPHPELENVIETFKKHQVLNVLDIGCGTGRNLVPLAEANFIVTGVDYSPIATHLAEAWLQEKKLVGKVYISDFRDGLNIFKNEEFDALVAINSLNYVESEDQLSKVISDIARVLKPQGDIFVVFPSAHSVIIQPSVTQIHPTPESLKVMFEQHFEIDQFFQDEEKSWVAYGRKRE